MRLPPIPPPLPGNPRGSFPPDHKWFPDDVEQSPHTLPEELFELASASVLHRFQSSAWAKYLQSKICLPDNAYETIAGFPTGRALICSAMPLPEALVAAGRPQQADLDMFVLAGGPGTAEAATPRAAAQCLEIEIAGRITGDLGASRSVVCEG